MFDRSQAKSNLNELLAANGDESIRNENLELGGVPAPAL